MDGADERLRALLDAVLAIGEDLELEGLLDRVVAAAARLVGAPYAALGVLDEEGERLSAFLHHGVDDATAARIGELPTGDGLLGEVISAPVPLRLDHRTDHPASTEMPPGHPPMDAFLGVPVRVGDEVFGNLYLTDKPGGFTAEDEVALVGLATVAGAAVRNARVLADAARQERWRRDLASLATAVLGGAPETEVLDLVAAAAHGAVGGEGAGVVTRAGQRLVVEAASGDLPDGIVQHAAVRRGLSQPASWARGWAVPLALDEDGDAVLVAVGTPARLDGARAVLTEVAAQARVLVRYAAAREADDRLAAADERARIARELHDTTVQRLFAAGLRLDAVTRLLSDRDDERERVETVMDELDEAIRDLREMIGDLGRPVEVAPADRLVGLVEGLRAVVPQLLPLQLDVDPTELPDALLADVLAVVREGITNAARHARATTIGARVSVVDGDLLVEVRDDGIGPGTAAPAPGGGLGLGNLAQRAGARGGACTLGPGPDAGSSLRWRVPLH